MKRDREEPELDMKEEPGLMPIKEEQREAEALDIKDEQTEPEPPQIKEEQEQMHLDEEGEADAFDGDEPDDEQNRPAAASRDQRRRNHDSSNAKPTGNKRRCSSGDVGEETDVVADLLTTPFSGRAHQEKLDIVRKGRPTPMLANMSQQGKGFVRHFQGSNYERYPWLTASAGRCRLYCWECTLFSSDRVGVWSHTGFTNLSCLSKAAVRHHGTAAHLQATVLLKTFGDVPEERRPDGGAPGETELHNEEVKKNRDILKKLVDCILFLGRRKLLNRGNYVDLLTFLAQNDPDLHYHLCTNKAFTGTSSGIQNDLIDAISEVIGEEIRTEISSAPFVAVMVDETPAARLAVVLRYTTDGGVRERFVRFHDVTTRADDDAAAAFLLGVLVEYGCSLEKVVAQCFHGNAVMASGLNEVQAKVKEKAPLALFIHSYAHRLNTVLTQGAAKLKHSKLFFAVLDGLAAFFSKSAQSARRLDDICRRHNPHVAPAQWQQRWRLVDTVFQKRWALKELFQHILGRHDEYDGETLLNAEDFAARLDDFDFCFLLGTFNGIFRHSDVLSGTLRRQTLDVRFCLEKVEEFCDAVERERRRFGEIYEDAARVSKDRAQEETPSHYQRLHGDILDNILSQMRNRFRDHEKLTFLSLLDPRHFKTYRKKFPQGVFSDLTRTYGTLFDPTRLKTELTVMYAMSDFEGKDPGELLDFLRQKRLTDSMAQLHALACVALTVPVSAASAQPSFSALKRIEAYVGNGTKQNVASASASMSIEKDLLVELKHTNKLYERVIDIFSRKEKRTDFIFK